MREVCTWVVEYVGDGRGKCDDCPAVDAAYDALEIRAVSRDLGHVAIIDFNRRNSRYPTMPFNKAPIRSIVSDGRLVACTGS